MTMLRIERTMKEVEHHAPNIRPVFVVCAAVARAGRVHSSRDGAYCVSVVRDVACEVIRRRLHDQLGAFCEPDIVGDTAVVEPGNTFV